jgi:G3E family GTPase
MAPRIPVTVLTGFLGSGKTTLLNDLLAHPQMSDTAVVINEFGEIALDHLLVESSIENTLVLQSGCICCTIRGDLVDTLTDLHARAERGEIPRFARVVVETTGLAKPAPILQTLSSDQALAGLFRLKGVLVTVDAVNGVRQVAQYSEASLQIAAATAIIVTKADIAMNEAIDAVSHMVRTINPTAALTIFVEQNWDADDATRSQWLPSNGLAAHAVSAAPGQGPRLRYGPAAAIEAISFTLRTPITRGALFAWLDALVSLRGDDILRLKALIAIDGGRGPLVVHGVQHLLHPPQALDEWPDADRRSRIVVIARNMSRVGLMASLRAACEAHPPRRAA